jgi:SAM-dependent methyltransferase
MIVPLDEIADLLRSPLNKTAPVELSFEGKELKRAWSSAVDFQIALGKPVLIDFPASVCKEEWFENNKINYSPIGHRSNALRKIKGSISGTPSVSKKKIKHFESLLDSRPTVLIVGSGTIGAGCEQLYSSPNTKLICFDIYPSELTQFIADAHSIPLKDECVDGVIVQAVLEHVLDPEKVVSEIRRVLRPGGIVYAETPFMQQVHEGRYDYTRFTELGHRWLFRDFESIHRDILGGPGLSLYWSTRYFFRAVIRNKKIADVMSLPALLFSLCDRLIPRKHQVEGANGVLFIGRKGIESVTVKQIASEYLAED